MIRNFLRKFMIGRYGTDHLNVAMIVVSIVIYLIHGVTRLTLGFFGMFVTPLAIVSYLFAALALFRMLSRNIAARRRENDAFIRHWWPIKVKINRAWANLKHRKTHKFFKCPGCGNTLRVPKGKGALQVTCPKCGERFMKKT